jgi:hypothetical protein
VDASVTDNRDERAAAWRSWVTGCLAGPGIDSSDHAKRGMYRSARDISQIRIREHAGSLRCFMFTLRHDRTGCEAGSDG